MGFSAIFIGLPVGDELAYKINKLFIFRSWSGIPDSDWRPSAWQADALPTELIPLKKVLSIKSTFVLFIN
jgi:hypothetical protein